MMVERMERERNTMTTITLTGNNKFPIKQNFSFSASFPILLKEIVRVSPEFKEEMVFVHEDGELKSKIGFNFNPSFLGVKTQESDCVLVDCQSILNTKYKEDVSIIYQSKSIYERDIIEYFLVPLSVGKKYKGAVGKIIPQNSEPLFVEGIEIWGTVKCFVLDTPPTGYRERVDVREIKREIIEDFFINKEGKIPTEPFQIITNEKFKRYVSFEIRKKMFYAELHGVKFAEKNYPNGNWFAVYGTVVSYLLYFDESGQLRVALGVTDEFRENQIGYKNYE